MSKRKFITWILPAFLFFAINGCLVTKDRSYFYELKTYSLNPGKNLLFKSTFISYQDYLFEFVMQWTITDTLTVGSATEKKGAIYSKKGTVYLLKNKSDSYFQFDNFSQNSTLIKRGKISEKEFGRKFSGYDTTRSSNPALYRTLPIDTNINNIKCYYVDINSLVNNVDSSLEQKIILYKEKNLNSFYKLWNSKYIDENFSLIGIYLFDKNKQQGFVEEPDVLRLLTTEEQAICKEIIEKAKF